MGDQSKPSSAPVETPAKRLANLFKQIVRENDQRDREAAKRNAQPKERDARPPGGRR